MTIVKLITIIATAAVTVCGGEVTETMRNKPVKSHGLVGLRPLSRTKADWKSNHGGSWQGTPTYAEQKGNYPFVAENLDVVMGWLDGDFKTKRMFFEYYWGIEPKRDVLDPRKNGLIRTIKNWEDKGAEVPKSKD